MIHAERGFSHFCNSWILLCNGDMRQFVLNVFADMFHRVYCVLCSLEARDNIKIQLPVGSMSDCSWDCPPASPSIRPGVIPSHLIPVNLGLARAQPLVNPQLSWLFGQFVINRNFFCSLFLKVALPIALLPEKAKGEVLGCLCPGCLWVPLNFSAAYLKQ